MGTRRFTRVAIAVCAAIQLFLPAPALRGDDAQTRKRILANWKAREERAQNFSIAYRQRAGLGSGAEKLLDDPKQAQSPLLRTSQWGWGVAGDKRLRWSRQSTGLSKGTETVVFDGRTQTTLRIPAVAEIGPQGRIATVHAQPGRGLVDFLPLGIALAFRPSLYSAAWKPEQFRFTTENAVIKNRHCVKIEKGPKRMGDVFWVDPALDDAIVMFEGQARGRARERVTIEYRKHDVYGWIPGSWTTSVAGVATESAMTRISVDDKFADAFFALSFPPGATVADERSGEIYRVALDGSKMDVEKFVSRVELAIREALNQPLDFAIEPQPLREALELIHKRCNIPIVIDERALEKAGIDATTEVKLVAPGLMLGELLKLLLEQLPKPLAFRVEDEVVKVGPATLGRPPHAKKPLITPDKLNDADARKMNFALTSAVDFAIEPQPLIDALHSLESRYGIEIVIDKKAFNDAHLDPTWEVKLNALDIRLQSALNLLAEQLPRPAEFRYEGGKLRMVPLPAASAP